MTPKEILMPRYRVTSNYPTSPFKIGDIITQVSLGATNNPFYREDEYGISNAPHVYNPENFPNIFTKLEWYQFRQPKDFPDYVKDIQDNEPYQIRITLDTTPIIHIINIHNQQVHRAFAYLRPATKEDYDQYMLRQLKGDTNTNENSIVNQFDIK